MICQLGHKVEYQSWNVYMQMTHTCVSIYTPEEKSACGQTTAGVYHFYNVFCTQAPQYKCYCWFISIVDVSINVWNGFNDSYQSHVNMQAVQHFCFPGSSFPSHTPVWDLVWNSHKLNVTSSSAWRVLATSDTNKSAPPLSVTQHPTTSHEHINTFSLLRGDLWVTKSWALCHLTEETSDESVYRRNFYRHQLTTDEQSLHGEKYLHQHCLRSADWQSSWLQVHVLCLFSSQK